MGWFDEDDDDEEEEKKRQRHKAGLALMASLDNSGKESTFTVQEEESSKVLKNDNADNVHVGQEEKEEEEEEDPLDSYMKHLANTDALEPKRSAPQSTRLDVENEDEATGHWESSSTRMDNNNDNDDASMDPGGVSYSASAEASLALQQTFHRASNSGHEVTRQVNIQLEKVEHSTMGYASFTRNLWGNTSGVSSTSEGHQWRREHSISCHPPLDPIWEFSQLRGVFPVEVSSWLDRQEGMAKPTLVQAQTLSVILSGMDAIVTAPTGSGKTLAYLLPLVSHLVLNNNNNNSNHPQKKNNFRALVLVPTRELALQVEKVAKNLLSKLPFAALAITGGNLGRYQLSQTLLKSKPHLIVATPGRLLDVLSAQQKSKQEWLLQEISFLVLDEADKMLQMGFAAQVSQLLENLRPDRQSMLTSATFHGRLERYCQQWMNSPTRIGIGRSGVSSDHVQQHLLYLPTEDSKIAFLKESLTTFCNVGRTIVFCAKREGCEQLAQALSEVVPNLQTLHGDKHPSDRKSALNAFSKGSSKLLIATDVAGRGLDIPQVATVINFNPAKNWDTHVHRIGRAGRLNAKEGGERQEGSAYTLLTKSDADFAQTLVAAYQREGRDIPKDILELSYRSKQNTAGMGRKGRQIGLGYNDSTGPFQKRSRWS